jgi:hypothetical protein
MVALVATAAACGMYGMTTSATAIAFQDDNPAVSPFTHENVAIFESYADRPDAVPTADAQADPPAQISFNDLNALLTEASKATPVTAQRFWGVNVGDSGATFSTVAVSDADAWAPYLITGRLPGRGEAVLQWEVAQSLGVADGDVITFSSPPEDAGGTRTLDLRVSGTMKSDLGQAPYSTGIPGILVNWDDSATIDNTVSWPGDGTQGGAGWRLQTSVGWGGHNGVLAPYSARGYAWASGLQGGFTFAGAGSRLDSGSYWALIISALLTLCVIIAAFAMGRAQAGARARWTATARVMGARRGTLVGASVVEAVGVGVASGGLGAALGAGGVAITLAGLRHSHPNSILPIAASVPAILVAVALGAAIVLSTLVAAMPAFWATRVEPVAALKPVTPLTERNLSRDVSPWWPAWITGAAAAVLVVGYFADAHMTPGDHVALAIALSAAWLASAVGLAALAVQGARAIVQWSGRVLQRSRRPWAIVAGDGLLAHRKLFTFAALSSLAFGTIVAAAATAAAQMGWNWELYRGWGEPTMLGLREWWYKSGSWPTHVGAVGPLFALVTVVAVAVTLSARQVVGLDAATQAALGLRRGHAQLAAVVRQFVPTAMGLVAGAILGVTAWMLAHDVAGAVSPGALVFSWRWHLTALGHAIVATAFALSYLLPIALAGALVVGLATRPGTPVEELRRTAGVRS